MNLKIELPAHQAAFRSGIVTRWHKAEGDPVEFGDDICDVEIDEFMALQRTKRASLLGSTRRRRQSKVSDAYDFRQGRGATTVRLRATEGGFSLGRIVVAEGERVEVGEIVGVLTDDGRLPDQGDFGQLAAARLAVNDIEPDDY